MSYANNSLQHCCYSRYYHRHFGQEKWDLIYSVVPVDDLVVLILSYLPDERQKHKYVKVLCNIRNWWTVTLYWDKRYLSRPTNQNVTDWIWERADRFEISSWFWDASNMVSHFFRKAQYKMLADMVRSGKIRYIMVGQQEVILENVHVPVDVHYAVDRQNTQHEYLITERAFPFDRLDFDESDTDSD